MTPQNIPIKNTVPISSAVLYPEHELADLNGFAWTQSQGIVIKSNPIAGQSAQDFLS